MVWIILWKNVSTIVQLYFQIACLTGVNFLFQGTATSVLEGISQNIHTQGLLLTK